MQTLVITLARGRQLWEITWMGQEVEIASGPRGREPEIEERVFTDARQAAAFVEAEVEAKRAEGWEPSAVEHDGGAAEREAEAEARRRARPTERAYAMRRATAPEESEPVTRIGGRPLLPPDRHWPECQQCFAPMQFLAQIRLKDTGDPQLGDGLLLLFQCDESPGCEAFSPDLGSNLAEVIEVSEQLAPLPIPDDEPRRSRVLERIDGVELVAVDRPLEPDPDDPDGDPYGELRGGDPAPIIGLLSSRPDWIQDEQIPDCQACRRPMRPVGQLEARAGGGINFGDVGCGYAFVCTGCRAGAFLMQCH